MPWPESSGYIFCQHAIKLFFFIMWINPYKEMYPHFKGIHYNALAQKNVDTLFFAKPFHRFLSESGFTSVKEYLHILP